MVAHNWFHRKVIYVPGALNVTYLSWVTLPPVNPPRVKYDPHVLNIRSPQKVTPDPDDASGFLGMKGLMHAVCRCQWKNNDCRNYCICICTCPLTSGPILWDYELLWPAGGHQRCWQRSNSKGSHFVLFTQIRFTLLFVYCAMMHLNSIQAHRKPQSDPFLELCSV